MSKHKDNTLTQQTLLWDFQSSEDVADQLTHLHIEEYHTASIDFMASPSGQIYDDRYEVIGLLGQGGMGEVLRVFDHKFKRHLAMKVVHPNLVDNHFIAQLSLKEAQSTGLLQHPGTVPVHDFGTLKDGRFYFTMQEIQGITLKEAIHQIHTPESPEDWTTLRGQWSIQRLLQAFLRICETLSYAHDLGLMHRDIKPSNFMLGEHGEVLVMDWGIAKVLPHGEARFLHANTIRPNIGSVVGTPEYISPEQAKGESDEVDARSDVFSLGCVLYEIITGKTIRESTNDTTVLQSLVITPPPKLPSNDLILSNIYDKCVALEPNLRYSNAHALEIDFESWLEGESKRREAVEWVHRAQEHHQKVLDMMLELKSIQKQLTQIKNTIPSWAPLSDKQTLWELEDRHHALRHQSALMEMTSIEWLHSALKYAPDLEIAHQELANIYLDQYETATYENNPQQQSVCLELIRIHDRGLLVDFLKESNTIDIQSAVPRTITLSRFQEINRQLIPCDHKEIQIPCEIELSLGSYQVMVDSIAYPIHIERHAPPQVLYIPNTLETDEECAFIPGGGCIVGSNTEPKHPRRTVHIDSFYMQRHPVTNRQFIVFLNDLYLSGQQELAWQCTPHSKGISETDPQANSLYDWDLEQQTFVMPPDPQGDVWDLDWPVILITTLSALEYARWYSVKTGCSWRLPTPLEWEKAGRGVDGRLFPWGNYFETTWAAVRGHTDKHILPAPIGQHPIDCSVYGIYGLGGNVQDMTIDPKAPDTMITKGGAWSHHPEFIAFTSQRPFVLTAQLETTGFRLVKEIF